MTRRVNLVLLMPLLMQLDGDRVQKAEELRLHNNFAESYNNYVIALHSGLNDLRLLRIMTNALKELVKFQKWSIC